MTTKLSLTFEYCAFQYLVYWEGWEKKLYNAISGSPNVEDICKALAYFRVARNFKGLTSKKPESAKPILDTLLNIRADSSLMSPIGKVDALAKKFLDSEFKKYNLSAASKLLWLSCKQPYIVYDNLAIAALKEFGYKKADQSYSEYCSVWKKEYSVNKSSIEKAIEQLPDAVKFLRSSCCADELSTVTREEWFKERVFDIFLWEFGSELGATA